MTPNLRPSEVEEAVRALSSRVSAVEKQAILEALKAHLGDVRRALQPQAEAAGVAPQDLPAYRQESERVRTFVRDWLQITG